MINDYSLNILIVEDEVLIADYIESILHKNGFVNTMVVYNEKDTLLAVKNYKPSIVLLDINLSENLGGIEIAKTLSEGITVIYLTGQIEDAVIQKALETNPYSYLTKPFKATDLITSIRLANNHKPKTFYCFKDGNETIKINIGDILFVKSDNNYIEIVTFKRKFALRKTLKQFLKEINYSDFEQVHRSYVINKKAINKTTKNSVIINDVEIPVSRNSDFNLE